jgi:PleD family two-component response regulator
VILIGICCGCCISQLYFYIGSKLRIKQLQTDENKNNNHNEISKENLSITKATTPTKKKSPYKILLVDDDDDILISIKHYLEDNDFIVDTFSSPLEAISAFKPELYDLLLIDIKMPEMNGFELYQN